MAAPVLVARGLRKVVRDGGREYVLLDGVGLRVEEGERVALVGPSGAGKSTLLQILGALDPHFEGSVQIDGVELNGLGDGALAALRNRSLGFVFQAYNLLGHLTVLDNVTLPSRFGEEEPDRERAYRVLDQVGMFDAASRRPDTLSGGERQRVAIARALYRSPRLLLCDEPTGNLDEATGAEIISLFTRLSAANTALVIATHDPNVARAADRVLSLRAGRLADSVAAPSSPAPRRGLTPPTPPQP